MWYLRDLGFVVDKASFSDCVSFVAGFVVPVVVFGKVDLSLRHVTRCG